MKWNIVYLPEAKKDLQDLVGNERIMVAKAVDKVSGNPLSVYEGGYGKPLGNKGGRNLTGFLKIKIRAIGIRVVYKLQKTDTEMLIVVIGAREDDDVYDEAYKRIRKHNL